PLAAQTRLAAGDSTAEPCQVLNGIRIGADWGDSAGTNTRSDSTGGRGGFRLGTAGATLDTTLTFDVAERSWSRASLTAYVAGGVSGRTRNASTGAGSRWHACVGVTLG